MTGATIPPRGPERAPASSPPPWYWLGLAVAVALFVKMYWSGFRNLYINWTLVDSYYTHGFLIPPISLWLVFLRRRELARTPVRPSLAGYAVLVAACLVLLLGDFLGFTVIMQLSMLPMLVGFVLVLLGWRHLAILWFPLFFLIFMIPIPPSITQSVALHVKLLATEAAVQLCRLAGLPMIRDGSFVHFKDDQLLVGEVCGGLRSLIVLLAFGALMAYLSRTRLWARFVILALCGPIAILANITRIFLLCVVGYFWGSELAAGHVHDASGILIFVVAFAMLFGLETLLRRIAPAEASPAPPEPTGPASAPRPRLLLHTMLVVALLAPVTAAHGAILKAQDQGKLVETDEPVFTPPEVVGEFHKYGPSAKIDEHTKKVLQTSQIVIQNYVAPNGWPVVLQIVHAGTTRRSLHFPEVCLVGQGWEIREQYSAPVGFDFTAKRLVLFKGQQKDAVLYWFKTGDTYTGSFFLNSWYWAYEQLTFGVPTSTMIKLSTPVGSPGTDAAFDMLEQFAQSLAPLLRQEIR